MNGTYRVCILRFWYVRIVSCVMKSLWTAARRRGQFLFSFFSFNPLRLERVKRCRSRYLSSATRFEIVWAAKLPEELPQNCSAWRWTKCQPAHLGQMRYMRYMRYIRQII